jgi:RNA polymerase sigma factor (TIGR02999 family)
MSDVTRILNAIEQGNTQAADELLPLVYEELRLLAAQRLSRETPGQTLQATALVHEAYIRLIGSTQQKWDGHGHFFAAAAEAMRRILIENARRKKSQKHGGNQKKVSLDGLETPFDSNPEELLALDEVLSRFTESDPKRATLLKLRYFAGMTIKQIAQCQGISEKTVFNSLAYARAWLHREIVRDGKST